jgi:hypothetical protein
MFRHVARDRCLDLLASRCTTTAKNTGKGIAILRRRPVIFMNAAMLQGRRPLSRPGSVNRPWAPERIMRD